MVLSSKKVQGQLYLYFAIIVRQNQVSEYKEIYNLTMFYCVTNGKDLIVIFISHVISDRHLVENSFHFPIKFQMFHIAPLYFIFTGYQTFP
jgi:hypothetical protein